MNIKEMSEDQVESLINEYTDINDEMKALKKKQDKIKAIYTEWLDNMGATSVTTAKFTAKLSSRKGTVDMKILQRDYKISDAELELFRKAPSKFWVVKKI